ncbi:hypothetical protein B9Z45_15520 [Limnohabitans sp. 2KL-17]|uniref:FHA domain-containing protein n=1 Tax=Limnohabitans sp. 2KL-17 TaxID=1100704 RepID=UPI000D36D7E9|nr:hypothetical protein B9Z45_15520 [Limnohabitans sp. 2KL-17]
MASNHSTSSETASYEDVKGGHTEIFQPPAKDALRELRVLSGLHKGAALTLSFETVTIGSDPNCTVVLLDAGVKPLHASLQWLDGKGWAQADSPEFALTSPWRVGPVWLSVVAPESPWTNLDLLHSESASNAAVNQIFAAAPPGFRHRPSTHRLRRWALLSICICSVLLLLITLAGLHTDTQPNTATTAAAGIVQSAAPINEQTQQPTAPFSSAPPPEDPSKDVVAVVNGTSEFVLMRDGQRIYVGEALGDFILVSVQNAAPIWRSTLHPSTEV